MNRNALSLIGHLVVLRWFSLAGQVLVIAAAVGIFAVPLPLWPMALTMAALLLFNLYARWRARRGPEATAAEVFAHSAVDVTALALLIGCSGGPSNPFTSLFLLPIAFAALSLPQRWIHFTALLCGAGYALAALFGKPLPHMNWQHWDGFDLHLFGMAVNFVISAVVFVHFLARMAAQRRERDEELARLREHFARDEGILALATQAAAVAHELNTPLATQLLLLEDMQARQPRDAEWAEDIALLQTLAETCRDRVHALTRVGEADEGVELEPVIAGWQVLRPGIELVREGALPAGARVDTAVGHLLRALLDNAADASLEAGCARVQLAFRGAGRQLHGCVRDHGRGFDPERSFLPGTLFCSGKPGGMGLGLALSHAAVERLGGRLTLEPTEGGGARVTFQVPLLESD